MAVCSVLLVGFFPSCYFLNYLIDNLIDMEERELTFRISYSERRVRRYQFFRLVWMLKVWEKKKASAFTGVLFRLSAFLREAPSEIYVSHNDEKTNPLEVVLIPSGFFALYLCMCHKTLYCS